MFFSPELLSRRDSGFGLLWLAATLGSQSTFKRLPKKSVLSADIKRLCDLIAEPEEPLALRLSSNLMIGVVRVYKAVKQELFIADITNCAGALKKVVQDVQSKGASDGRLELAQATARPLALTLPVEPANAAAMDLDAFISDWDHYLNIGHDVDNMDIDYDPRAKPGGGSKQKQKQKQVSAVESARADQCTLEENHDEFLSSTFNTSMDQAGGFMSSHDDFIFDDVLYPSPGNALNVGGLLDEDLSQELNDAWEGCSPRIMARESEQVLWLHDGPGFVGGEIQLNDIGSPPQSPPTTGLQAPTNVVFGRANGNMYSLCDALAVLNGHDGCEDVSPDTEFSRLFLSQDSYVEVQQQEEQEELALKNANRLQYDHRTELTDEEMRQSRFAYMQIQNDTKREITSKVREKNSGRVVETLLWNIPAGIQDQALAAFWQGVFKTKVRARPMLPEGERPGKRRRHELSKKETQQVPPTEEHENVYRYDEEMINFPEVHYTPGMRGSSEDPGGARHASNAPLSAAFPNTPLQQNADAQEGISISQKDSLFPWDHAAASSSSAMAGLPLPGSDNMPFEVADMNVRTQSSPCERGSSPFPAILTSEASQGRYEFVVGPRQSELGVVAAPVDPHLVNLEKNSSNFLEYVPTFS
ncbi:hypothetical protein AX16_009528 [Volvariella volvacea WC 439]|nr:hypothetical protein AX16_009528 [Volvariella volvacea WC 439]